METLAQRSAEDPDGDASAASIPCYMEFGPGDLVWGKRKGQPWWPAVVAGADAATAASSSNRKRSSDAGSSVMVTYFRNGGGTGPNAVRCHSSQLKPFFAVDVDELTSQSTARGFLGAVEGALGAVVRKLERELTCSCSPDFVADDRALKLPLSNYEPKELLECLRDVAVDGLVVGSVECLKLKSWVFAFGKSLNEGGVKYRSRCTMEELVEMVNGEDDACGENASTAEEIYFNSGKKRSVLHLTQQVNKNDMMEADDGVIEIEDMNEFTGCAEDLLYLKRERKRSKYLSPPYTDMPLPASAKSEKPKIIQNKIVTCNVDSVEKAVSVDYKAVPVSEILTAVCCAALDVFYLKWNRSAKVVKSVLANFRSSKFIQGSDYEVHSNHKCEAANLVNVMNTSHDSPYIRKKITSSKRKGLNGEPSSESSVKSATKKREKRVKKESAVENPNIDSSSAYIIGQVHAKDIRKENKVAVVEPSINIGDRLKETNKLEASESASPLADAGQMECGQSSRSSHKEAVKEIFVNLNTFLAGCSKESLKGRSSPMVKQSHVDVPVVVKIPPMDGQSCNTNAKGAQRSAQSVVTQGECVGSEMVDENSGYTNKRIEGEADDAGPINSDKNINDGTTVTNSANYQNGGTNFIYPAALQIEFHRGVILPSRDEVLEAFRKYGMLIDSQTDVLKDTYSACVVFEKSADAEAAYNNSEKLGVYGPPFATSKLHYMSPVKINGLPSPVSQPALPQSADPASKPMLTDVRKNLELMISSMSASNLGTKDPLFEGLQGLLAKVDGKLHRTLAGNNP